MMEVKKTPATALEFKNIQSLSNGLISNIVPCRSDNDNVDNLSILPKDDSKLEQNEETYVKDASGSDTIIVKEPVDTIPTCDVFLKNIYESETPNKDSVLCKESITEITLKDDKNDNHQNIEKTNKPKLLVEVIGADQQIIKNEKFQGKENCLLQFTSEVKLNNEERNEINELDKIKIDHKNTKELLHEMNSKRYCEINAKDKTKLNEESINNEKSKELLKKHESEEYNLGEIVNKYDNEINEAVDRERQSFENKTEKYVAEIDESILKRKSVTEQNSSSSCDAYQELIKKNENEDIVKIKSKIIQISTDKITEANQRVSERERIEDYNENQNISTDNNETKTEVLLSAMQYLKVTTKSNNSNALEINVPQNMESIESKNQKDKTNLERDDKLSEIIHTDYNTNKICLSSQKKNYISTNFSKDELSKEKNHVETAPSDNITENENKDTGILLSQIRTPIASGVSSSLLTRSKSPLVDGDIINLDSPLPEDEIGDTKEDTEVNGDILKQIDYISTNSAGTEEKSKEVAQTYLKKQPQSEDDDDVVMFYQKTKTDNSESDEDVVIVEKKTEKYKSCTGLKKSTSEESITTPKDGDRILLLDDVKEQGEETVNIEKNELYNKKKLHDSDEIQVEEEIFSFDTRLGDRQKSGTKVQEDDDDVVLLECESDNATESIIPQKTPINSNTLTNAKDNSGSTSTEEKSIINASSYIANLNEKMSTVAAAVTDKTKNIKKNEIVDLDLEDEKSENGKRIENKNIICKSNTELTCTSRQVEGKDIQEIPRASEIVELDSEKEDEQIESEFKHADEQIIEPDAKQSILVSDNSDNAQDKFPENLLAHDSKSRDSENLLQATNSPQNSRSNDATMRSKAGAEISNLESSAEPPLKRARVEKINDKDPQKLVNEKENSFKGSVSPDPLTQESKKIKLFHEDDLAGKSISGKLEDSHIFKAKRIRREKLEPTPQASKKVDINLDFLRKFKKSITEMTKSDLEELVLQKVVEAIVYKSEFSEMREMIEKQETTITTHRTKLAEITKQFRDLEMVHNRVLKDLETKNQQFIMPVKITRAVGLQVLIPKRIDQTGAKCSFPATVSQQTTLQSSSNVLNSAKRRSAPKVTPFRPEATSQVVSRNASTVPVSIPQKIDSSSPQNKTIMQHKVVNRNTVPPTQQNLNQLSLTHSAQTQYIVQPSQIGQTSNTHQMTLKKSAAFVRTQQPPAIIQKSQISQNAADRRVPPMILKKTSANGRILTVASPDAITPSVSTAAQNTSFAAPGSKSVIDLTDEDDANNKTASSATLPALVAIPNHAISTRVTYVVNQPNNIASQRVTITQNGATVQKIPKTKMNTQFVTIAPKPTSTSSVLTTTAARLPSTTILRRHPAPLPKAPASISNPSWKNPPPRPSICINNDERGIVISWTMDDMNEKHAEVTSYQIYAYQETNAVPAVEAWRHVGDVKAMLLPMAVTLTQFQEGQRYYFAVRAVDIHTRCGPFSMPITWT